jgi:hypothetical protein
MQVPAVVEPIAPEQPPLGVRRNSAWNVSAGCGKTASQTTAGSRSLPPARDHSFRDTADQRRWLRELLHDVEYSSGMEGMVWW